MRSNKQYIGHVVFLLLFVATFPAQSLNLNDKVQTLLSNPETGLIATTPENRSYEHAARNTLAITNALKRLGKGEDLLLPEGIYDVETILAAKTLKDVTISGAGFDKTILRRSSFGWDNNVQGACPYRTEVMMLNGVNGVEVADMTLDGNCHQIQVCGYGSFNPSTGAITSGYPQFPSFESNDDFQGSAGSVMNVTLSYNISFNRVKFSNGFRWCVMMGKIDGFTMRNSSIDTGNLSSEFKGHLDALPNSQIRHVHTSQDGIHLVNVSNAVIEYNDIHSEDSAIAIELNPTWEWGGFNITENVRISNNSIWTASPTDPDKLMTDADRIYGTGLNESWTGQSAVDIFYNENYDINGANTNDGSQFRNIEISRNDIHNVRQGVRCGFFLGAGAKNAEHFRHRISQVVVKDHNPMFRAGRDSTKLAGIRDVTKNTFAGSWNRSGGAGIVVRHTDSLIIDNNVISRVSGGLGVSILDVTHFDIINNEIDAISGTQLGDLGMNWPGGEAIRIHNDGTLKGHPNYGAGGIYDAERFLVKGNRIGATERNKIAFVNVKNGVAPLSDNYTLDGLSLRSVPNAFNLVNVQNVDTSEWKGFSANYHKNRFKCYPNPFDRYITVEGISENKDRAYRLSDIKGGIIAEGILQTPDNSICTAALPSGVYFIWLGGMSREDAIKIIKL